MLKFNEFEKEINKGRQSYVYCLNKKPKEPGKLHTLNFDDIVKLTKQDPDMEIGWIPSSDYIIIDIDDRDQADRALQIIRDRKEQVMVVNTTHGIHIYCVNNIDLHKRTVRNVTAIGFVCDTLVDSNNPIVTPFRNPRTYTGTTLKNREIVYYNGIKDFPKWLTPLYKTGNHDKDNLISVPLVDARNDTYFHQLRLLKSRTTMNADERDECIRLINKYVAAVPLTDQELDSTVLRESNNQDIESLSFFEGTTFKHDAMGKYLIDLLKIKKSATSKLIYYYDEDEGIYINNDDYIMGYMTKISPSLKDFQKKEVLTWIKSFLELDLSYFNQDPYKISFKNGLLDIRTLTLEPHSCEKLETMKLHVDWNPAATGPTADEFFNTATCGDKVEEQLLYEAIGYSFMKTSELHKAFLLIGSGRNGKSTYLDIIKAICGRENCTSLDFKDLGEKFRVGMLHNKLVSLSGDISSQPLKDSDLFKQIVGGDEITIEHKNMHPFNDTVFATLFFSANTLPRTPDTTSGFYRRLCIIPFNADLTSVSLVNGMEFKEKLLRDTEYIAYKAVMAINNVLLNTHTFTQPKSVESIMDDYKIENSSVLSWLNDSELNIDDIKKQTVDGLYAGYSTWCETNGYKKVRIRKMESEIVIKFNLKRSGKNLIDNQPEI